MTRLFGMTARSEHRFRIGAQDLQGDGFLADLLQDVLDQRFFMVADEIDEEHVGPFAAARRAGFDAGQVDTIVVERYQQLVQGPRLVAHGNDDRGLVVAGRRHLLVADDQEARGVVRAVLDLLVQLAQVVQAGRHVAGDRRRIPLALHPLGRVGVARHRHPLDARVVRVQPLATLREGLGMGIDPGDVVGLGGFADQQVMVDTQFDFAADHHVVLEEAVEGMVDRPLGGVFHRHHAEVHRAAATSRNTSSIAAIGVLITALPKCLSAAAWVKVPSGPR